MLLAYFVTDKLRLDADIAAAVGETAGAAGGEGDMALELVVGARYSCWRQGNVRLNSGLAIETIQGPGGKKAKAHGTLKSPFEFRR